MTALTVKRIQRHRCDLCGAPARWAVQSAKRGVLYQCAKCLQMVCDLYAVQAGAA